HDWLTGWSKLPGGAPEAHKARAILADILPQGLAFTRIAHELEWAESEARLAGIAQRKLDLPIRDLGGAPFLDALRDAHRHYGEALGLPHPAHERDQVSDSLEDFLDALRTYVVRVTAHVDRDDPATIALAEQLLAPLTGGPRRAGSPA
ncbi:MAG: hypothetical protein HUU06_14315, partial [Planctomycetaceae bacterium]|nr:hypothetical protein [Planctomycetaceae bacterium]